MRHRLLSLLLICAMLLGFSLPVQAAAAPSKRSVVYIPLDDRPFNDQRVRLMAQSLGMDLVMPDKDLYATKLDGQTSNPNGTQYGDREALLQWLQRMDRSYDTFIISLDQLLSGGLMNSRCMDENQDLALHGGMSEYEVIDYLATLAKNNQVYIIDSVLRLATSCNYGGYDLDHYTLFRLYGQAARPVLSGEELNVDTVAATYRIGQDGLPAYYSANLSRSQLKMLLSPLELYRNQDADPELAEAFLSGQDPASLPRAAMDAAAVAAIGIIEAPDSALDNYLNIRERKLRLTEYALKNLAGMDKVHYLLGIDDSSAGNNIQSNEIALFSSYLSRSDHLISSSLDGLGQMALTKLFQADHQTAAPKVQVTYFGDRADVAPSFNHHILRNMVDQTLDYLGAVQTQEDPDLSVLVVTACDNDSRRREDLLGLVSRLNENEYNQIPTILMDVTGSEEPLLNDLLVENTHLSMLLSFSGQYEGPNQTTMALSQGLARYLMLLEPSLQTQETQSAHLENLFSCILKELAYADSAVGSVIAAIQDYGLEPQNMGALDQDTQTKLEDMLTEQVNGAGAALLENLTGNYISSLLPCTLGSVSAVSLNRCTFPWLRQSEIDLDMTLALGDSPAKTGAFHRAYIAGVTESTFEPDGSLTRAQTAKLLVSVGQLPLAEGEKPFPDTAGWAEDYILAAHQAGLVSGYPDGTFRPENSISRAEFAQVVYQLARNQGIALEAIRQAEFSDAVREGVWFSEAIYALADAGLMDGYPEGTFLPNTPISRAEAVVVLNRLLRRTEDLSSSLSALGRFTDVPWDWRFQPIQEASVSHFAE